MTLDYAMGEFKQKFNPNSGYNNVSPILHYYILCIPLYYISLESSLPYNGRGWTDVPQKIMLYIFSFLVFFMFENAILTINLY